VNLIHDDHYGGTLVVGEYTRARKRMYKIVFNGEDNGEIYKHLRFRLESN
jgi:hypothetical protein